MQKLEMYFTSAVSYAFRIVGITQNAAMSSWVFVGRTKLVCAVCFLSSVINGSAGAVIVDFEDIPADAQYRAGDIFTTSGVQVTAQPFQLSNGSWISDGYGAYRYPERATEGSGYELFVCNVDLEFDIPESTTQLSLLFAETGGNFNLLINDDFRNFQSFPALNGVTIGGVSVTVAYQPYYGHYRGALLFEGPIDTFAIGGQELVIDDLHLVPEPSSLLALLAGLGGFGVMLRRRWR